MIEITVGASRIGHRKRNTIAVVAVGIILVVGILFAGTAVGYRVNTTPSAPLGIWRIRPLYRPVAVGDLVFVCTPATATFVEAQARGYLRRGLCASGYAPLIKTVIAIAGQRIDVGIDLHVDGRATVSSGLRQKDGKGRPLLGYPGGIVPAGNVFLHSPFPASWDSRYFGPIPASGILGLAQEVLTYAP